MLLVVYEAFIQSCSASNSYYLLENLNLLEFEISGLGQILDLSQLSHEKKSNLWSTIPQDLRAYVLLRVDQCVLAENSLKIHSTEGFIFPPLIYRKRGI